MKLTWILTVIVALNLPAMAKEKQDPKVPTPEAQALIEKVKDAYGKLKSLKVTGKLSADIDVGGRKNQQAVDFVAQYRAPMQYRHEVAGEVVTGSTGTKQYLHEVKQDVYMISDAPEKKTSYRQLPGILGQILEVQDPALLLAVTADSVGDFLDVPNSRMVRVVEPTVVDGATLPTLAFTAGDGREIKLAFDPQTYLLRQATYDIANMMRNRGAQQVNKALMTVAYSAIEANGPADDAAFAWSPPASAREIPAASDTESSKLEGKAAPDFSLNDLQGKQVKLSELKGSVVLLDFWATWCPPCVRSLPEVNALHNEKKASGVKVYAVNVGEGKGTIEKFLAEKKLELPVLMDEDEAVMNQYGIQGIPTTIIIRADGLVHKVLLGMPPGGKADLERELDAAAAAK